LNTTFTPFGIVLVLNVLWFGAGFWQFFLRPDGAAKVLVPRSARSSPLFKTVSASIRFLGGMNLTFCVFAALLLANPTLFPDAGQLGLFAAIFSLAHGSQFYSNVPIALGGGRQGESYWPVLRGPMLYIFVIDGALMLANGVLAAKLLAT